MALASSGITRRAQLLLVLGAIVGLSGLTVQTASAQTEDKVVFATNWRAQAGHGGFYQAVADGTYKKLGLDVEIQQGGPQVNNRPLLAAGKIDFLMAGNLLLTFDAIKNGVPITVVGAIFQKDPQAIIAHPGQGYESWADLKGAPTALISKDGQFSFWQWMKAEHGFKDEQLKPYTFNLAPWLADKKAVQQAYSISEPISVRKQGGFDPKVFLLADQGFSTYSTTVETRSQLVKDRPDLVKRFMEGSIIGWYNYLYGDNKAANELIKKQNPDISDEAIVGSIALMKSLGIVDSGDAQTKGIGTMSPERVKDFHDKMVKAGVIKAGDVDLAKVAVYDFVGKGIGVDVRKALTGK
jgi:NitT/TauT family transport system substrate-binding protein